jgi:hypothetical protein
VVLEKKIFKWPHPIFTFLWLSPHWRGPGPLFEQTWIPFFLQFFFQTNFEKKEISYAFKTILQ